MPRPVVIAPGSINVDLILKTAALKGPKTFRGRYSESQGGKGSNQALAARRAAADGTDVYLVGCVGDDEWGAQALQVLRDARVRVDHVRVDPGVRTGVVMEYLYGDGEVTIALDLGANATLRVDDIDDVGPRIEEAAILLAQIENPLACLEAAVTRAGDAGVPVLLDPSVVPEEAIERRRLFEHILPRVDLLAPNRSEAQALTGIEIVDDASALRAAAELARHVRTVVITRGADGAVVARGDDTGFVRGLRVDATDGGAAGDTFRGALGMALAEILEGHDGPLAGLPFADLCAAARFANAAAALCVTRPGAAPAIPTRSEIDALLAETAQVSQAAS